MNQGWIGVDLDGTLAYYDQWRGIDHVGVPIPDMLVRVQRWLLEGKDVRIFTARLSDGPIAVPPIQAWCLRHLGRVLPVTNVKDKDMLELWDDRSVQVVRNTGVSISEALDRLADMVSPRRGH